MLGIPPPRLSNASPIKSIYINQSENGIYLDTLVEEGILLLEDPDSIFQIVDTTSDNNWLFISQMNRDLNSGRMESRFFIYHVPTRKKISRKKLGPRILSLLGFTENEDERFLVYLNAMTLEKEKIRLNKDFIESRTK